MTSAGVSFTFIVTGWHVVRTATFRRAPGSGKHLTTETQIAAAAPCAPGDEDCPSRGADAFPAP